MQRDLVGMIRRGMRKPPRVIAARIAGEVRAEAERLVAPGIARSFGARSLLRALDAPSIDALWDRLAARPSILPEGFAWPDVTPEDEKQEIVRRAEQALHRRVDLLGSGEVSLGTPIDWHADFKTGYRWPPAFHRSIEYNNPDRPSDVKVPWETSRLQWLLPAGQAYLLTGDERYARAVRDVLEEWISGNPYAMSVNWSCTMEVALRILTWTWFFHVFKHAEAWQDETFRTRLLSALFLHGRFTTANLERSDVNGNHYTADAAGLVFAGLFFGEGRAPRRWLEEGWAILSSELELQVTPDGVDFEASVPYHRLVAELFLLPALYRLRCKLPVQASYADRVRAMGRFTAAYARLDGTVPLQGDADDARALPMGLQSLNDHRYLVGLIGEVFEDAGLSARADGLMTEVRWLLGPQAVANLSEIAPPPPVSTAFEEGGIYVLANALDHVFVDCAPLGLAGRGGHGHNDCLSFEAVLGGVHLVSDAGAYLYTASFEERNRFRSTAYHNTPRVNQAEINRFIRPDYLWNLHNDAMPKVRMWQPGAVDRLVATHTGYERLEPPVRPVRSFELDHAKHSLTVRDEFEFVHESDGVHPVGFTLEVPMLLAPGVTAEVEHPGRGTLRAKDRVFRVDWDPSADWTLDVVSGRVSPSYGVVVETSRLVWRRKGPPRPLRVTITPEA